MDFTAKITSKGQVTLPAAVRRALDLRSGDRVVFSMASEDPSGLMLEDSSDGAGTAPWSGPAATMTKSPDLIALAGSVPVPARWRGVNWNTIRREAWTRHALDREARSRRLPE